MIAITSSPVQIWPPLSKTQLIKKSVKRFFDDKFKILRKHYYPLISFIIICTILLNVYYIFVNLIPKNSITNSAPTDTHSTIVQQITPTSAYISPPIRLKIPSINVNASIQPVGQAPDGNMDVPSNTYDVGWYKYGPIPGQKGSAVINAHVDNPDGSPAVFSQLYVLKEGDSIIVENEENKSIYFLVKKVTNYTVDNYTSDVFDKNDDIYLNLITCSGTWDYNKNTYSQRLVVFASAIK